MEGNSNYLEWKEIEIMKLLFPSTLYFFRDLKVEGNSNTLLDKKKLSLRHPLPTFGSFIYFQASLWPWVDKVLQKLTKSYKSELENLFQWCILIPRKCPHKTPFQHTEPPPPTSLPGFQTVLQPCTQRACQHSSWRHGGFFKAHILTSWIDSIKVMEIYGKISAQNKLCILIIKKYINAPKFYGCWKTKYLWPILCLHFWGPEAMNGNNFKEKKEGRSIDFHTFLN